MGEHFPQTQRLTRVVTQNMKNQPDSFERLAMDDGKRGAIFELARSTLVPLCAGRKLCAQNGTRTEGHRT